MQTFINAGISFWMIDYMESALGLSKEKVGYSYMLINFTSKTAAIVTFGILGSRLEGGW